MADTRSTIGVERIIRTHLLTFVSQDGVALSSLLGTRLFITRAYAPPTYPFAVMNVQLATDGAYNGIRKEGEVELMVFDKGERNEARVQQIADIMEEALFRLAIA